MKNFKAKTLKQPTCYINYMAQNILTTVFLCYINQIMYIRVLIKLCIHNHVHFTSCNHNHVHFIKLCINKMLCRTSPCAFFVFFPFCFYFTVFIFFFLPDWYRSFQTVYSKLYSTKTVLPVW